MLLHGCHYINSSFFVDSIFYHYFSQNNLTSSNLQFSYRISNQLGLEAAVEATAEFLNKAVKPVIVAGPKLRVAKSQKAFVDLANACGFPIAIMPSAKGLVPEHHPHFIGTYWGAVSTSFCGEIVESADAYVFVGPIFNDYSSVGYSLLIKKEKSIIVQPNRVTVGNGLSFGWVFMADFLTLLAKKLKKNSTAVENYRRIFVPPGVPLKREKDEPLRVNILFKHIQVRKRRMLHSLWLSSVSIPNLLNYHQIFSN